MSNYQKRDYLSDVSCVLCDYGVSLHLNVLSLTWFLESKLFKSECIQVTITYGYYSTWIEMMTLYSSGGDLSS